MYRLKKQPNKLIEKLYDILQSNIYNNCIKWSDNGKSINLIDEKIFQEKIMPQYFNSTKIKSFYRQLQSYSFKIKQKQNRVKQISNQYFIQGKKNEIIKIQRKKFQNIQFDTPQIFFQEIEINNFQIILEKLNKQQTIFLLQFKLLIQIEKLIYNQIENLLDCCAKSIELDSVNQTERFLLTWFKIIKGFAPDIATKVTSDLRVVYPHLTPLQTPQRWIFEF